MNGAPGTGGPGRPVQLAPGQPAPLFRVMSQRKSPSAQWTHGGPVLSERTVRAAPAPAPPQPHSLGEQRCPRTSDSVQPGHRAGCVSGLRKWWPHVKWNLGKREGRSGSRGWEFSSIRRIEIQRTKQHCAQQAHSGADSAHNRPLGPALEAGIPIGKTKPSKGCTHPPSQVREAPA